jgi:hypothetical protein
MSLLSSAREAWKNALLARRANRYARGWQGRLPDSADSSLPNSLQRYCAQKTAGRGLWKWEHYLEVYDRHFAKFRGQAVHVMEIGVYSGGSLEMWNEYFGSAATLYGVDIEPDVKAYETDNVRLFIGDQGDRAFWDRVLPTIPTLDVVIDDGGHELHQQMVTLEAVLPHMRNGGVYLCEDIHGGANPFAAYVHGLTTALHSSDFQPTTDQGLRSRTTPFQSFVHSIHVYPFVTVIEVRRDPLDEVRAPRLGTQWQPFYEPAHRRPAARSGSELD